MYGLSHSFRSSSLKQNISSSFKLQVSTSKMKAVACRLKAAAFFFKASFLGTPSPTRRHDLRQTSQLSSQTNQLSRQTSQLRLQHSPRQPKLQPRSSKTAQLGANIIILTRFSSIRLPFWTPNLRKTFKNKWFLKVF